MLDRRIDGIIHILLTQTEVCDLDDFNRVPVPVFYLADQLNVIAAEVL